MPTAGTRLSVIFTGKSAHRRTGSCQQLCGGGARLNGQYRNDYVRQPALHHDCPELHGTAEDSQETGSKAVLTSTKLDRAALTPLAGRWLVIRSGRVPLFSQISFDLCGSHFLLLRTQGLRPGLSSDAALRLRPGQSFAALTGAPVA